LLNLNISIQKKAEVLNAEICADFKTGEKNAKKLLMRKLQAKKV
jgi:hypothetical protein